MRIARYKHAVIAQRHGVVFVNLAANVPKIVQHWRIYLSACMKGIAVALDRSEALVFGAMSVKAAFFALIPAGLGKRSAQKLASTIQRIPKPLVAGSPSVKPIQADKAFVCLFAKRQRIVGFSLGCRIAILKDIVGEVLSLNSKLVHTPQRALTVLASLCLASTMP
jgi:hypothetical protein